MSDKLQDVRIIEDRGSEWAKERTLDALVKAVGKSNQLLKAIGGEKTKNIDLKSLDRLTNQAGRGADRLEDLNEATEDLRGKLLGFGRSIGTNTREVARSTADLAASLNSTSGFMRGLSGTGNRLIGSMGRLGPVGAAAAVGMTAVATAAGLVIDRVMASRDAFMSMTQAGLYFGGNSLEFAATVRESGLELREFTSIAEKYNVALLTSAGAETGYLRQVRALGSTFDRLNMTIQDGSEYFAEFLEQSRLSNREFQNDELAQRSAFIANAEIQQELARLTGVTVRQQREEARQAATSRQAQAMMMALDPAEADRIRVVMRNLTTVMGLTQQQAEESVLAFRFGRPMAGALQQAFALDPGMRERVAQEVTTGGTVESARRLGSQQEEAVRRYMGSPQAMMNALLATGLSISDAVGIVTSSMFRASGIDTTRTGAAGGRPGQPIDAQTQTVNEIISNTIRAIGSLDASIIRGAGAAMGTFQEQLKQVSDALAQINPENLMTVLNGIRDVLTGLNTVLGPILGTLGKISEVTGLSGLGAAALGVGAAGAAAYGANKLLRSAPSTLGTPPTPPGSSTPPGRTGMRLPGGAPTAMALGLGGAAAEAAGAPGWLSGAAQGAALGMMLGPKGALVGGALGGIMGYMRGNGAQAASGTTLSSQMDVLQQERENLEQSRRALQIQLQEQQLEAARSRNSEESLAQLRIIAEALRTQTEVMEQNRRELYDVQRAIRQAN